MTEPQKRTIWFTSDNHFGHKNVIKYCNRPFTSVEEMDEEMIKRWNEVVKPGDLVYLVGDFSFYDSTKAQAILDKLNGEKHFIYGNHDKQNRQLKGWQSVSPYKEIRVDEECFKGSIVLCHYAMRVWNKSHHGALMLYGHSHGSLPTINNQSTDIGVDSWDYRPVSLAQVVEFLKKFPDMVPEDHHSAE